jgi:CxxC motif-containing protein (DUF1111 family)
VAAAKTVGKAMLNFIKIKTYKDFILKDMYDSLKNNKTESAEWDRVAKKYNHGCSRLSIKF